MRQKIKLQPVGGAHTVFLLHGGQDMILQPVVAKGHMLPQLAHFEGGDIGLENQLGDVGRGGVALWNLVLGPSALLP